MLNSNEGNSGKEGKEEAGRSEKKPAGLSGLLKKIGKDKPSASVLEQSRQDWNEFKKAENLEEDLANHSRGKDSFLERKAFLERADLRQFEIEKEFRDKERSRRENNNK